MANWIPYPTTLSGETVELISLEKKHFAELELAASDKKIWEFYPFDCSNSETFLNYYNLGLIEREKGTQFPFVIFHKQHKKLIGSTRYLDVQPKHRKLEIGFTWLQPAYWATEVNLECKLLLLTHCFETLNTVRVQLKTDENNKRSQKAIAKIGAQYEGILRNDMLRDDGTNRNSAYFSIIDKEWTEKKVRLEKLYKDKKDITSKVR
ncbi:MAG TPA: GNAT family protein [Bacteroidia bacterium]|nr:GNAT family protein [Bacteroidia bacterium]